VGIGYGGRAGTPFGAIGPLTVGALRGGRPNRAFGPIGTLRPFGESDSGLALRRIANGRHPFGHIVVRDGG
jgi:hypothetical protein